MIYNLFFMFGGVVAMLFGMKCMGAGLEKSAGTKMKALLGKVTSNRFAGVGVGLVVTSIIQSSTATTVMLVGFVNIGLLTLTQAAGVVMGANIGTTITAHIVSLSGVGGAVDIGAIAACVGFIGIMITMLFRNDRLINLGNILAGLGMVFVGLEFISIYAKEVMFLDVKNKVPHEIVAKLFQGEHSPIVLVLIGIVITALVHSSSTITSLMVVFASIGVLPLDNALFLALGSNIGTCVTSIMSSIGTCANAKRTAVMHLLFNLFGCIIFFVPICIWRKEIIYLFESMSNDVGQQIAIFHTLFNVIATIILFPLSKYLVKLAILIIPEEKKAELDEKRLAFLDDLMIKTPTIAVGNIRREIVRMGGFAKQNLNLSMKMLLSSDEDYSKEIAQNEEVLNFLNHSITGYMTKLIGKDLSVEDDKKIGSYFHVVSDLERIGDYAENIMEYSFRLRKEDLNLSEEARKELQDVNDTLNDMINISLKAFDARDVSLLPQVDALEQKIDDVCRELEARHVERLKKGLCHAQIGSIYLQTVSNLERSGDHITNVAFSLSHYRHVEVDSSKT